MVHGFMHGLIAIRLQLLQGFDLRRLLSPQEGHVKGYDGIADCNSKTSGSSSCHVTVTGKESLSLIGLACC